MASQSHKIRLTPKFFVCYSPPRAWTHSFTSWGIFYLTSHHNSCAFETCIIRTSSIHAVNVFNVKFYSTTRDAEVANFIGEYMTFLFFIELRCRFLWFKFPLLWLRYRFQGTKQRAELSLPNSEISADHKLVPTFNIACGLTGRRLISSKTCLSFYFKN
jgi:hypothetical protein